MENYVYHESEPENRRTSYKPFGVVDFVLNANGRSLALEASHAAIPLSTRPCRYAPPCHASPDAQTFS